MQLFKDFLIEHDKKKYENVGIYAYGNGFDSKTMKRHYV